MKKRRAGKIVKIIALLLVLVVVGGGVFIYVQAQNAASLISATPNYSFKQVSVGDVLVGVTAKGVVSTQTTTNIVLDWSGQVKEVNFEVGDLIAEGDILAVVQNDDLDESIRSANSTLQQQVISLERQKDALDKSIAAPASGRIKSLKAVPGEDAQVTGSAYGQLCLISPDGIMELTCDLAYEFDVGHIFDARDEQGNTYKAEVVAKGSGKTRTLEIHDDVNLEQNDLIKVYWQGQDNVMGEGRVTVKNAYKVTGSGKITEILVQENQMITRGETMFILDTTDAQLSYKSQSVNVSDAQRKVSELRKDLDKSDLPSPVSGVITALNLTEGTNANSGQSVATIMDTQRLQTVVNVDELDIAKIQVGQKVQVTLEALEGKTYTGTVTKIAVVGTNTNNFATFPVTIALDPSPDIKIGMSCEATIEVQRSTNALRVPVEVLQRTPDGYAVLVVTGGLQGNMQVSAEADPKETASGGNGGGMAARMEAAMSMGNLGGNGNNSGAQGPNTAGVQPELRQVEVGLINEDYAEILSGLEEGDIVAYVVTGTSSLGNMMMMGGGTNVTYIESSGPAAPAR